MFHHSGYVLAACLSPSNWGTTECVIINIFNRFSHFPCEVLSCSCLTVIVVHEIHSQMHHNHC